MSIKKIVSAMTAAAVAAATIAVSAVSVSAADSVSCKLYTQNTNSWTVYESDAFDITSDGGDFTVTVNAGGETDYITLYVKDVTGGAAPASLKEGSVTVNSIKVNGKDLGLTKTEYDLVNGDSGILDVCFINGWADTFVEAGDAPMDENGDSYTFGEAVDTFEVSFSVNMGGEAAAAPAEDTAEEAPAEEVAEEAADDTAEEAPASEEAAPVEDAPAADTAATTPAQTGNTAASAIAVVMVAAAGAMVASKRK